VKLGLTRQQTRDLGYAFALVTTALFVAILWQALFVPRLAQSWFGGGTVIPAAQFSLIQGKVLSNTAGLLQLAPEKGSVVIEAPSGLTEAQAKTFVHWYLQRKSEKTTASISWESPTGVVTQAVLFKANNVSQEWVATGDPRWMGAVPTLRLQINADLPVTLGALAMRTDSVAHRLYLMWDGWFGFRPWKMSDINFIEAVDATENYYFNLTAIIAVILAWATYAIVQTWRKQPLRLNFLLMIFLMGWVWTTIRWEAEFTQKVADTWKRFGGKTLHEKHLAADDHEYYWVVENIAPFLPKEPKFQTPVVVHFASEEKYDTGKLTYYATPRPLVLLDKAPSTGTRFGVVNVANAYNPATQQLTFSNGTTFRAEKIAERGGAAVYRAL
jgi:hypothetical protein